jgi:hypothetical protein
VSFVEEAEGDEVHDEKRSWVFFHENAVLGEERPDGLFEQVKEGSGSDFEANNQPLVAFLGDDCIEDGIELGLVSREVFDVDFLALSVVKEDVWLGADESR